MLTSKDVVFKGGTALSKCNNIIERFSEDIDLVVLRNEGETNNQLKTKIKKISNYISGIIPEIDIEGITHKKGMIRKTAHSYEKCFDGDFNQVRDNIIVESTWLGHFEPYESSETSSYIYEMMLLSNQDNLIEKYQMRPFEVLLLSPKRTLCEKIMSLVRFSQTENPISDLNNKIRHIYDIYMILENQELNSFFESSHFDDMLIKVANDDVYSFKNNNKWLYNHPSTVILFSETENTWAKLENTYNTIFKDLVFGKFPEDKKMLSTLNIVSDRLKKIKWNIENLK